jgi:hypothetical protein
MKQEVKNNTISNISRHGTPSIAACMDLTNSTHKYPIPSEKRKTERERESHMYICAPLSFMVANKCQDNTRN